MTTPTLAQAATILENRASMEAEAGMAGNAELSRQLAATIRLWLPVVTVAEHQADRACLMTEYGGQLPWQRAAAATEDAVFAVRKAVVL